MMGLSWPVIQNACCIAHDINNNKNVVQRAIKTPGVRASRAYSSLLIRPRCHGLRREQLFNCILANTSSSLCRHGVHAADGKAAMAGWLAVSLAWYQSVGFTTSNQTAWVLLARLQVGRRKYQIENTWESLIWCCWEKGFVVLKCSSPCAGGAYLAVFWVLLGSEKSQPIQSLLLLSVNLGVIRLITFLLGGLFVHLKDQ